jgi:hypothetical protein
MASFKWPSEGTGGGTVTSVAVSGGTTGLSTTGGPITGSGTIALTGTVAVSAGGTGDTTLPLNELLIGNGASPVSSISSGTAGQVLTATAGAPTWAYPAGNAPVTSSSAGSAGQIAYDATHIYVCVATNTWVRATLATF